MIVLLIYISLSIPDNSNLPTQESTSPVAYYQCINVVRMIEHLIRKIENPYRRPGPRQSEAKAIIKSSDTVQKIVQSLSKSCNGLTDTRKSVCKEILTEQTVQKIYDLIKENQKFNIICAQIGYKRSFPAITKIVDKKFCSQVIDLIRSDMNKNSPINNWVFHRPKINPVSIHEKSYESPKDLNNRHFFQNRKLYSKCKQFIQTSNYQQCLALSRILLNEAIPQIQSSNSSESVCEYLESKKFIQFTGN